MKKIALSVIAAVTFVFAMPIANTNVFQQNPQNIIQYLLNYGAPYKKVIMNNANLELIAQRIFINGNKKALLIRTINKTSKAINVQESVNYGYAVPKILGPFQKGWLLVTNFVLEKPYKYNVTSFDQQLFEIITQHKLTDIEPYFANDIILVKLTLPNQAQYQTLNQFNLQFLGKGPFVIFTRLDRQIDDKSNRWGFFINGFLNVSGNFWVPYTFYFVIHQGKIVKILWIDKFLNFEQFKTLVYKSSH